MNVRKLSILCGIALMLGLIVWITHLTTGEWGLPVPVVRSQATLVGPENQVYTLLFKKAPLSEIVTAAKSDLKGNFSFCYAGRSLLTLAAENGRPDVVKALLDLGMSPNHCPGCAVGEFEPPLQAAIQSRHVESVKALLGHGADPTLPDRSGLTAEDTMKWTENCDPRIRTLIEDAVKARRSGESKERTPL